MPGAFKKGNPLVEAAKLNTKLALVFSAGANRAAGYISPIGMRPRNSTEADVRRVFDETPFSQPVQIESQSILQANPFSWPWHSDSFHSVSCQRLFLG